jgi:hypothetical protein
MTPPSTPSIRASKSTASRRYGLDYLTMDTVHAKSTLQTSIGKECMMHFLEKHVPDLHNSKYKRLLKTNANRAEAVILVQKEYWENNDKVEKGTVTLESVPWSRLDHPYCKIAREHATHAPTPPPSIRSATSTLAKLQTLEAAPEHRRKKKLRVVEDEKGLARQKTITAETLGNRKRKSSDIFEPVDTKRLRWAPSYYATTPENSSQRPAEKENPVRGSNHLATYNRDPKCIAEARSYLEILIRNSREEHFTTTLTPCFSSPLSTTAPTQPPASPSMSEPSSDVYFSDAETDIFDSTDSATLLGLRFHPLNSSNAQPIIDDIVRNEAILWAGYRGKDLLQVAQAYEEGRKRLVSEVRDVVPWDEGLWGEEQAARLVDQLFKGR